MTRATVQQLVDCIRLYQRGNTREDMLAADKVAERLVGLAPVTTREATPAAKAKPRRKAK